MAKQKENKPKKRAPNYEEKVKFDGTLEEMIAMAVKPKSDKKDK
jgi:hypothetical protein